MGLSYAVLPGHARYHSSKPKSGERLREALKPGGALVIEGFAGGEKFMIRPMNCCAISWNYELYDMRT